jgi:hypothetical protein
MHIICIEEPVIKYLMKGFPQLEELDITLCSVYGHVCWSVGKACPQLKCFRLNERWIVVET